MFTRLSRGRAVRSSEGFSVERVGSPLTQFVIRYSEGDHVLEYPLENLMPDVIDKIYVDRIGPWNRPHQDEVISVGDKRLISNRIREAMDFLGDTVQVVDRV